MKLKYILLAVAALVVIFVGLALTGVIGAKSEKVTVEKVAERTVIETVTASGKIQPETEVKLSSEVSGEVVQLLVKEGDIVKKGQLLVKVRPDVLLSGYEKAVASNNTQKAVLQASQQQLNQALETFKNTESTYKRNQELFKKKVISASEFDAAKAEYFSAQADIARLRANVTGSRFSLEQSGATVRESAANLAKTTITAPVDGVISKLSIELGDRILGTMQMAGTEIMRISNLSTMEVNVDVNENDINRVNVGDSAIIEVDAFADKKFKGVVTEIASSSKDVGTTATSSVDQVTNFLVKVRILPESYNNVKGGAKDLPSPFRPGMSASADIQSSSSKGLSIPIQSIFTGDKGKTESAGKEETANDADQDKQKAKLADKTVKQYVYTYASGTVKKVEVTTGIQDDQYIIINSGLKVGTEVVTAPYAAIQNRLKDGDKVEKTSKEELFKDPAKK
jgi:HlyD family secretion protein